jgi:hypothetical protein
MQKIDQPLFGEEDNDKPVFSSKRANAADLIVIPDQVRGALCQNCEYYKGGFCDHPKIQFDVNPKWCCSYWHRPDAPRVADVAKPILTRSESLPASSRMSKSELSLLASAFNINPSKSPDYIIEKAKRKISRMIRQTSSNGHISRFSDCGHTDSGDFSDGNTCGSLRGKVAREHAHKHVEYTYDRAYHDDSFSHADMEKEIDRISHLSSRQIHEIADKFGLSPYSNDSKKKLIAAIKEKIARRKTTKARTQFSKSRTQFSKSRFSDCGHTPEGEFDFKNTCASLRGGHGGKSGRSPVKTSKPESSNDPGSRSDKDISNSIRKKAAMHGGHKMFEHLDKREKEHLLQKLGLSGGKGSSSESGSASSSESGSRSSGKPDKSGKSSKSSKTFDAPAAIKSASDDIRNLENHVASQKTKDNLHSLYKNMDIIEKQLNDINSISNNSIAMDTFRNNINDTYMYIQHQLSGVDDPAVKEAVGRAGKALDLTYKSLKRHDIRSTIQPELKQRKGY